MSRRNVAKREELNLVTNEEEVVAVIKKKETERWHYGLFIMFVSISAWMISNQLINAVIKSGEYGDQPIFISYVAGSGFIIYLLPELSQYVKNFIFASQDARGDQEQIPLIQGSSQDVGSSDQENQLQDQEKALSTKELIWLSAQVLLIYFFNNAFSLVSLQFTSSSQQVLLTTSTSFFTLILGSLCKVEVVTLAKLGILLLAVMGVSLITFNDAQGDQPEKLVNPLLGDMFALCSSFCYACYLVLIKLKIGETAIKINERLLFGFVGLSTLVLIWPSLVLLKYIPIFAPFAPPQGLSVWTIVILNGVLTAISDYCTVILMLLTSPLVVSLSLTTLIPIGMICDSVFYGINKTGYTHYIGMLLIFLSLVLTNLNDSTIDTAIEDALEDAILKDENLSPLLSPLLSPHFNKGVGAKHDFHFAHHHYNVENAHTGHEILVSGGNNHKYTIRGLANY